MRFVILSILIITCACTSCNSGEFTGDYLESHATWKQERIEEVEKYWIPLIGLEWLEEGRNSFGSSPENELVFPESTPDFLGEVLVKGDTVHIEMLPELEVFVADSLVDNISYNLICEI